MECLPPAGRGLTLPVGQPFSLRPMVTSWAVSQIDLSDPGFWGRPFGERTLRSSCCGGSGRWRFSPSRPCPRFPPAPVSGRSPWRQDFARVAPTAAEEIVRWSSPVIAFRRTLTRDAVLSGQQVAAGAKVMLFYPSANRDERAFPHAYRFDLARAPNPHLGYGGPGPHYCLGAHLARAEIQALFRALFT